MNSIIVKSCPICASVNSVLFDQCEFKGYPIENHLCENCGCVYQSPRMDDEALDAFYAAEYRNVYQGSEGPTKKDLFVQQQRAQVLANFLKQNDVDISRINVHLDIGCSSGLLLVNFREEFGFKGTGVEPGQVYRNYAQQHGLEVFESLDELKGNAQGRFGLISMIHVLEHLAHPIDYLKNIAAEYLAEDGYLLIEVPNLYMHDSFEVAHLVSYCPQILRQTLIAAGFEVVAQRKHGEPRSRLLPLYITVLARAGQNPAQDKIQPEKRVALKRRTGMLYRRIWERILPGQAWLPLPQN